MGLIDKLIPLNYEVEKAQFFAKNCAYNPQFVYSEDFSLEKLTKYGLPDKKLVQYAKFLLQNNRFVDNNNDDEFLSQDEIIKICEELFAKLNVKPLTIGFADLLGKAIYSPQKLIFNQNLKWNKKSLFSTLDHEVQTHYLRGLNGEKQPWKNKKRKKNWKFTEEGLAAINSRWAYRDASDGDLVSYFYTSYLYYLVVSLALQNSFQETFAQIKKFCSNDDEWAFAVTMRAKRGVKDTSKAGAFTKDIVYFAGFLQVVDWLVDTEHDPRDLYLGKISLSEVASCKKDANWEITVPTFFEDLDKYVAFCRRLQKLFLVREF